MRQQHDIRQAQQFLIHGRFALEHIQPGARNLASLQSTRQRGLVNHFAARRIHHIGFRLHQVDAAGIHQVERRRRVRTIDGHNVHAGQHLVQTVPIGRFQQLLDTRADRFAVVIVNLQAKGLGAAGDRLADAAHADNAQTLACQPAAHHPGRRPAIKAARIHDLRAFEQAARHGQDQRHGDIRRIIGQHARRVGHGDAALNGALHINIVHACAELRDQAKLLACPRHDTAIQTVRHGRHQHICRLHRVHQFILGEGVIILVQPRIKQFLQPQFYGCGKFTGHNDFQLLCRHGDSFCKYSQNGP